MSKQGWYSKRKGRRVEPRRTPEEIEILRLTIAKMYEEGHSQLYIGEHLKVSKTYVAMLLKDSYSRKRITVSLARTAYPHLQDEARRRNLRPHQLIEDLINLIGTERLVNAILDDRPGDDAHGR